MNLNKVQNLKILTKNVWKDKKCTKFSVLHVIPSQKEKKFSLTQTLTSIENKQILNN